MENESFLEASIRQFRYYRSLGEKAIAQIPADKLAWQYNPASNSMTTIVRHLAGNMLSRWTDFLSSDGEKEWRNRDEEFETAVLSPDELLALWNKGWDCLLHAVTSLKEEDLQRIVYIRNQGHTVTEAICRQLSHYPYHVGQLIFIAKMIRGESWQNLSIAPGQSKTFNAEKFSEPKHRAHFTADELEGKNQLARAISQSHERFWNALLLYSQKNPATSAEGKWSAAQLAQHIRKLLEQTDRFLATPREILAQKFGTRAEAPLSREAITQQYKARLDQGVNAPDKFRPDENCAALDDEIEAGRKILASVIGHLETWTEKDLDRILCPHQLLGSLSEREVLWCLVCHTEHHERLL